MGWKTAARCLRLGAGLAFVALALALIVGAHLVSIAEAAGCPPGQVMIPLENRCVGIGEGRETRCREGEQFDARENRCVRAERATRCPEGEQFDARENRCVRAERATRCPEGEQFDARENRCVRAGPR